MAQTIWPGISLKRWILITLNGCEKRSETVIWNNGSRIRIEIEVLVSPDKIVWRNWRQPDELELLK